MVDPIAEAAGALHPAIPAWSPKVSVRHDGLLQPTMGRDDSRIIGEGLCQTCEREISRLERLSMIGDIERDAGILLDKGNGAAHVFL